MPPRRRALLGLFLTIVSTVASVAACSHGRRRQSARRAAHQRREAKKAEDRHIGFRWLAREARLASEEEAEELFRAVAAVFAERVGRDESRHVASHLPLGQRETWDEETARAGRARHLEKAEFVGRVQTRLGIDSAEEAEEFIEIVFAWLKHLALEERTDIAARLSGDLRDLWERAQLPHIPWHVHHASAGQASAARL